LGSNRMMRYDVAADNWTVVAGSYAELVEIPGANGLVSSLIALPAATDAPVQILGSDLDPIGELPAFPGDPSLFGEEVGASANWVGEEAVFRIWAGTFPHEPEQVWALNPTTQAWRQLDSAAPQGREPLRLDVLTGHLVVAGDVLLAWGEVNGPAVETFGVAYRSGTDPSD
jgi:hypothetical protein